MIFLFGPNANFCIWSENVQYLRLNFSAVQVAKNVTKKVVTIRVKTLSLGLVTFRQQLEPQILFLFVCGGGGGGVQPEET